MKHDNTKNNYCKFFLMLCAALIAASCSRPEYKEMRVYPVPAELSVAKGGESFIALKVEIPKGYHMYGNPKGPGTGKPTRVFIKAPGGMLFQDARYLAAKKFYFPGEQEYTLGYERETTLFVPFRVGNNARIGAHSVGITFDSLICSDAVSPGSASACTPKLFQIDYTVRALPAGSAGSIHDARSLLEYNTSKAPTKTNEPGQALPGLIKSIDDEKTLSAITFSPRFIQSGVGDLVQAILFGILAGFILNFMPCVLPVVSIKIMSFVEHADKNRKQVFLLGMVFSMGILTSFAALASLAAFSGYRWGGLFQHRSFLVAMTGLVFAMALSLFGVFTIQVPAFAGRAAGLRQGIYADAYVKGLLATLLATPCSGPFLGGTLAWTLSKPPQSIFLVFMCIGFGMSLPYLILTSNPKFLKLVPKPGEWLKSFEQAMAFLLVFTVIYLVGIFDAGSKMPVIVFLGFVAVGLWQYGRYGSIVNSAARRLGSFVLLAAIIISGYLFSFHYLYVESETENIMRNDFSVQRMLENKKAGKISMIEFTADWCPNCKLVEKTSLQTDAVASAVKEGGIDFMRADITRRNPAAEKLLLKLHTQSIPLLAVVPPGASFESPVILRDIYSEKDVLNAIEMAAREGKKNLKAPYQIELNVK